MPRPVRHVDSQTYFMLTNRCLLGMYLLAPDPECRRIIKGCLARAADHHDVELVCFCFLANHFHLIARFPKLNMAEFMEQFQSQLASRINDHRGDRSGTVFPERYDDQALLDEQVLRDKIAYVLNNPVKDRQVKTAERWPGVTSIDCHKAAHNTFEGRWLDHQKRRKYERRKTDDKGRQDAMETHEVELHLPECLDGTTDREKRRSLLQLVERDRHRRWADATGDRRRPPRVAGPRAVERLHWADRPETKPGDWMTQNRWLGVASSPEKIQSYADKREEITERYRRALSAWRNQKTRPFPHGTYPPGHRHCVGSPLRS